MGLFAGVKAVLSAIRDVAMAIINGFKELLGIHSPSTVFEEFGVNTLLGFINGLNSKISDLAYLVADIISELLNGISSKVSDFVDVGKSVIDGFITGLKSKISEAASWTTNLANSVLDSAKKALGINSPSKEFAKIGMYANEGLAEGLDKFSGLAEMASENVGNTAIKSLSDVISNIADVVSGDIDLSPTIRPVLDLSNVQTGNKELTSIFNNQTIAANARAVELVGSIGNRSAQTQTITSTPKGSNKPGTIQNTFCIASLVVREEADVKKVARQLYQFQLAGSRG
jgi:hypothetical protein